MFLRNNQKVNIIVFIPLVLLIIFSVFPVEVFANENENINEYCPDGGDMSYEKFLADSKTQSAVIMQLQVIGELAKKMPEEIKESVGIPWKQIIGMRDMVSHDYFNLDIKTVWDTATKSVPEAKQEIEKYLM